MRLNTDFTAEVHPFLNTGLDSKFGIPSKDLDQVMEVLKSNEMIEIVGVHIHIGSTVRDVSVFKDIYNYAKKVIFEKQKNLKSIRMINIGGGLAIDYHHDQKDPHAKDFISSIAEKG